MNMNTSIRLAFDDADSDLFKKIIEARQDINHSLFITFNPCFDRVIRNEQRKHIEVMKEYIAELQKQREDLRVEFMEEFDNAYGKPPF